MSSKKILLKALLKFHVAEVGVGYVRGCEFIISDLLVLAHPSITAVKNIAS